MKRAADELSKYDVTYYYSYDPENPFLYIPIPKKVCYQTKKWTQDEDRLLLLNSNLLYDDPDALCLLLPDRSVRACTGRLCKLRQERSKTWNENEKIELIAHILLDGEKWRTLARKLNKDQNTIRELWQNELQEKVDSIGLTYENLFVVSENDSQYKKLIRKAAQSIQQ